MARFDFEIPDGFLKQLGRLADVEKYAPQMLKAAAPIVVASTMRALSGVTSSAATGEMTASVKAGRIVHNKYGWFMRVNPSGKDINGTRNMEKAAYLEYGTSKQNARPWLNNATNGAMTQALDAMREAFRKAVDSER